MRGAIVLLLIARVALADRTISGTVVDARDDKPIAGATVAVGERETVTDLDGHFVAHGVGVGWQTIVVAADKFEPLVTSGRDGASLVLRLVTGGGSEVIQVEGRAPLQPERHALDTDQLHSQPGAGNDALRAVQSLPGVARTPYGLGGLALRGAAPHDTKVFLDGIEVPILYHFGGLASFLPIDMLAQLTLEPSGFAARYGRGIGGVVVLESRSPRTKTWLEGGELSLIHAAAIAEGPGPMNGTWLVGVRRSYIDAILDGAGVDLSIVPAYGDAQVRWESGDHKWMALLFASDDHLFLAHDPSDTMTGGINTSDVSSFDYFARFARLGLRWRDIDGQTVEQIIPSLGITQDVATAERDGVDKGYHRLDYNAALRADLETPWLGGLFRTGLDARATHYTYTIQNTPPAGPDGTIPTETVTRSGISDAIDAGVFVDQTWTFGRVMIRPSARVDTFGLAGYKPTFDPRLAISERLPGDTVLSENVGVYHEPPLVTDLDPIFGNRTLAAPWALQSSVALEAPIGNLFDGQVAVYYAQQHDLPVDVVTGATPISANGAEQAGGLFGIARELVDDQFGSYSYREYVGLGHAYGVEVFARRELGKLTGWISYTYSRAFRTGDPRTDPTFYPWVLDQPHMATVVATYDVSPAWRTGLRFRYATGNPFTPAIGGTPDPNHPGQFLAINGPILSERLPAFLQLDLRVDHAWHTASGGLWVLYLDVQNVTNNENAEGVTYNADYTLRSYTRGLPVFPSIGIEYRPRR